MIRTKLLLAASALTLAVAHAHAQMTPCGDPATVPVSSVSSATPLSICGGTTLITNAGTAEAFLASGPATITAVAGVGISLLPGQSESFNFGHGVFLGAVTALGTSTSLRISQGNGNPAIGANSAGSSATSPSYSYQLPQPVVMTTNSLSVTGSAVPLASNPSRKYLSFTNESLSVTCRVMYGGAPGATSGFPIYPQQTDTLETNAMSLQSLGFYCPTAATETWTEGQ